MARCYRTSDGYVRCYSAWDRWVRWVVLAVTIGGFAMLFFLCSCYTARRRRRMGLAPYRGTGWLANQHGPAVYNPNGPPQQPPYQPQTNQQPAPYYASYAQPNQMSPSYSAPPYVLGQQQTGIELQAPQQAYYNTNAPVEQPYQPPPGPPPTKT